MPHRRRRPENTEPGVKQVLLLLCKGVEIYEAAAFHDVLNWPDDAGRAGVQVVRAGLDREIHATFGMKLLADVLLSDVYVDGFDALAVPGGYEAFGFYEHAYSEPVAQLIRRFSDAGKPAASICVGALALGHAGILRGRRATTYGFDDGLRRRQLATFGAVVVDEPVVIDGNVITSTSPATAMDVAFDLLAKLCGAEHARQVRHSMGFAAR